MVELDNLNFEIEDDVPIPRRQKTGGRKKQDPLKLYIFNLVGSLKKNDDRLIPLKKLITDANATTRVRNILNLLQEELKNQEDPLETWFKCESVKDGFNDLIGIKVTRIK